MVDEHQHIWLKTGEYHPTNSPIWFYVCECGACGKARDGEEVYGIVVGKKDAEFYRFYWLPAMRLLEKK